MEEHRDEHRGAGGPSTRERIWRAIAAGLFIAIVWQAGNAALQPPRTVVVAGVAPPIVSEERDEPVHATKAPALRPGLAPAEQASPVAAPASPAPPAEPATATPSIRRVGNTGGEGVYLRSEPRMEAKIRPWVDDTPMELLGEEADNEGRRWLKVRDPEGTEGWVPAEFLVE